MQGFAMSAINEVNQPRQSIVNFPSEALSIPVLFVKTLFEPLYISPKALQKQFKKLRQDGAWGIMRRIGRAILKHPSDTFVVASSLLLGYTNVANELPGFIPVVVTAQAIRNSKQVIELAQSMKSHRMLEKGAKVVLYGMTIYMISSTPAVAGFWWSNQPNPQPTCKTTAETWEGIVPVKDCVAENKHLQDCLDLVPANYQGNFTIKTHHASGAISTIGWNDDDNFCFRVLQKSSDTQATEDCYADIRKPCENSAAIQVLHKKMVPKHSIPVNDIVKIEKGHSERSFSIRKNGSLREVRFKHITPTTQNAYLCFNSCHTNKKDVANMCLSMDDPKGILFYTPEKNQK